MVEHQQRQDGFKRIVAALSPTPGIKIDNSNESNTYTLADIFAFSILTTETAELLRMLFKNEVYDQLGKNAIDIDKVLFGKNAIASNAEVYVKDSIDGIGANKVPGLQTAILNQAKSHKPQNKPQNKPQKGPLPGQLRIGASPATDATHAATDVPPGAPLNAHFDTSIGAPNGEPDDTMPIAPSDSVMRKRGEASWLKKRYAELMDAWYEAPLDSSVFRKLVAQREKLKYWNNQTLLAPLANGACRVVFQTTNSGTLSISASSTDERSPYAICALLHHECQPLFDLIEAIFNHSPSMWDRYAMRASLLDFFNKHPFDGRIKISHMFGDTTFIPSATPDALKRRWPFDVLMVDRATDSVSAANPPIDSTLIVDLAVNKLDAERGFEYFVFKGQSNPFTLLAALRTTGDHAPVSTLEIPTDLREVLSTMLVELVDVRMKCAWRDESHSVATLQSVFEQLGQVEHIPLARGIRVLLKGLIDLINESNHKFDHIETMARALMRVLDVDLSFASSDVAVAQTIAGLLRSMLYEDTLSQNFRMSSISKELFENTTWVPSIENEVLCELCTLHGDAMRQGAKLMITDDLAFRWRKFQTHRLDVTRALVLQNVSGMGAFTLWTNIDCEMRYDDLLGLCSIVTESATCQRALVATIWLTLIAWQLHQHDPLSNATPWLWQRISAAEQAIRANENIDVRVVHSLLTQSGPPSLEMLHRLDEHIVQLVYDTLCTTAPSLVHELRSVRLPSCKATSDHWYVADCVELVRRVTTTETTASSKYGNAPSHELTQIVTEVLARIGDALVADRTYSELVQLFQRDASELTQLAAPRAASLVMHARGGCALSAARFAHLDNHMVDMYEASTVMTNQPLRAAAIVTHVLSANGQGVPVSSTDDAVVYDIFTGLTLSDPSKPSVVLENVPFAQLKAPDTFGILRIDDRDYMVVKRRDIDRLGIDIDGNTARIDASSPLLDATTVGVHTIPVADTLVVVLADSDPPRLEHCVDDEGLVMSGLGLASKSSFDSEYQEYSNKLSTLGTRPAESLELFWWMTMHSSRKLPPKTYADGTPTPLGTVDRPLFLPSDGTLAEWYEWAAAEPTVDHETTDYTIADNSPVLHTGGTLVAPYSVDFQHEICSVAERYHDGQDVSTALKALLDRVLSGERVCVSWIKQTLAQKGYDLNKLAPLFKLFETEDVPEKSTELQNRQSFLMCCCEDVCPRKDNSVVSELFSELHMRHRDLPRANEGLTKQQMRQLHAATLAPPRPELMFDLTADSSVVLTELFRVHGLAVLAYQIRFFASMNVANIARAGVFTIPLLDESNPFHTLLQTLEAPVRPATPATTSSVMFNVNCDFLNSPINEMIDVPYEGNLWTPPSTDDEQMPSATIRPLPPHLPSTTSKPTRDISIEARHQTNSTLDDQIDQQGGYYVGNVSFLNGIDGVLSSSIPHVLESSRIYIVNEKFITPEATRQNGEIDYETWYRDLCDKYNEVQPGKYNLICTEIDSNENCAKLHEQAVLHTAAWLLSHSNDQQGDSPDKRMEPYREWIKNKINIDNPRYRPLLPMEFLPNVNTPMKKNETERLAATFLATLKLTATSFVGRDQGFQTVRSLVHFQNNFQGGRSIPARKRCSVDLKQDIALTINTWRYDDLPSTKCEALANKLETACVLKMQSSSDIEYAMNEKQSTAKEWFKDIFEKAGTRTIEQISNEEIKELFFGQPSNNTYDLRLIPPFTPGYGLMFCRKVKCYPACDAVEIPDFGTEAFQQTFQPSKWDVAQPYIRRTAEIVNPSTLERTSKRSVTNSQSASNPQIYLNTLGGVSRYVGGSHRGEAWMDGSQTTPEALRNLAQAVRKHMTYARIKKLRKLEESTQTKAGQSDTVEEQLMNDIQKRLNAKIDTTPFSVDVKISATMSALTPVKHIVVNVINHLLFQLLKFNGKDIHLREMVVLVEAFVTFLLYNMHSAFLWQDVTNVGILVILRYWSFISNYYTQIGLLKLNSIVSDPRVKFSTYIASVVNRQINDANRKRRDAFEKTTSAVVGWLVPGGSILAATAQVAWQMKNDASKVDFLIGMSGTVAPYIAYTWLHRQKGRPVATFFTTILNGAVIGVLFSNICPLVDSRALSTPTSAEVARGRAEVVDVARKKSEDTMTIITNYDAIKIIMSTINYFYNPWLWVRPSVESMEYTFQISEIIQRTSSFVQDIGDYFNSTMIKEGIGPRAVEESKVEKINQFINSIPEDILAYLNATAENNKGYASILSTDTNGFYARLNYISNNELLNLNDESMSKSYSVFAPNETEHALYALSITESESTVKFHMPTFYRYKERIVIASVPETIQKTSVNLLETVKSAVQNIIAQMTTTDELAQVSTPAQRLFGGVVTAASELSSLTAFSSLIFQPLMIYALQSVSISVFQTKMDDASRWFNQKTGYQFDVFYDTFILLVNQMIIPMIVSEIADQISKLAERHLSSLTKRLPNAQSRRSNKICREATLCGWYTTAQLKLLGPRRVDRNRGSMSLYDLFDATDTVWDIPEARLRVKHDLQALNKYAQTTGFHLMYTTNEPSVSKTSIETTALVDVIEQKKGTTVVDEHIQRDFEKAVVMARDGPCARETRLVEDAEKKIYSKKEHPVLIDALNTFVPLDQKHGHVWWPGTTDETVQLSDAFEAALTNLLAIDGDAAVEYEVAGRLQKQQFNQFDTSLDERSLTFREYYLVNMVTDGWIDSIRIALCHRTLKYMSQTEVKQLNVKEYRLSIMRQTYFLLGRMCVLDKPPPVGGIERFEDIPANLEDAISHLNTSDNLSSLRELLMKNNGKRQTVYFVSNDDLLMDSFAYPSSLLEQTF